MRFTLEAYRSGWLHHPLFLPRSLRGWLTDQGSLTRRLKQRCAHFSVRPVRLGLYRANKDESQLLRRRSNRLAYVREVVLECDRLPVVFAHSVISLDAFYGPWAAVARLGSRPLGEALFSNRKVVRGRLQYRQIASRHPLARQAARAGISPENMPLWARRSLFTLKGHPILVTEVFLQAIERIRHD